MNGSLHQIIALAINGNALRRGVAINGFWPKGGAFVFDHETSFHRVKSPWLKGTWIKANPDPMSWFAANAAGYRIHFMSRDNLSSPDHMTNGFTNGGPRWFIEAAADQKSSFWEVATEVTHPNAANSKIWTTQYSCVERDLPAAPAENIDLQGRRDRLHLALENILAFSVRQKLGFSETFAKALRELNSEAPLPFSQSSNILPSGFKISLAARQLLASVQHGYVFGGMGSWNDQYWSDADLKAGVETEYDRVSSQLFACLNDAVVAATNSTFSDG